MKKLFSVFVVLFAAIVFVSAQTNIEKLIINYKFDYSQMVIDGMEAKGFIAIHENEGNETPDVAFEKFTQKLEVAYVSAINGKFLSKNNLRLDNDTDSKYLLILRFKDIDKDGEHKVYASLMDKESNKSLADFTGHAESGNWGSFSNLFFESIPSSAKKISNKVTTFFKKMKK